MRTNRLIALHYNMRNNGWDGSLNMYLHDKDGQTRVGQVVIPETDAQRRLSASLLRKTSATKLDQEGWAHQVVLVPVDELPDNGKRIIDFTSQEGYRVSFSRRSTGEIQFGNQELQATLLKGLPIPIEGDFLKLIIDGINNYTEQKGEMRELTLTNDGKVYFRQKVAGGIENK